MAQLGCLRKWSNCRGFTMVELLVVITVMMILAALITPSLSHARELANRAKCMNNLHQLGIAEHAWANDHEGWFYWVTYPQFPSSVYSGSAVWQPDYTRNPHFFEGLSNYVKKTDVLYCPSALRRRIDNPNPAFNWKSNQIIQPWGSLGNSHLHYGHLAFYGNWMSPDHILIFEVPHFIGHVHFDVATGTTGGACYLEMGTGDIYQADGTTLVVSSFSGQSTTTAHQVEGSNVLYVDGRVAWVSGKRIGPIKGYSLYPPGYEFYPTDWLKRVHIVY